MKLAELRAGLDADLVDQASPGLPVGLERLGLSAGAIESEHLQVAQAFAQWMLGDQALEPRSGDRVAAELQLGVDPALERDHAKLLEPCNLRLCEGLEGEIGQGVTPPLVQCALEQPSRLIGPAVAQRLSALVKRVLKPDEVEVGFIDPEQVAARGRHEDRGGVALGARARERLAQARDVHAHALHGSRGGALAPERVDQAVGRDALVRVERQQREDRPLLGSPQRERPPIADYLKWPKEAEIHHGARLGRQPTTAFHACKRPVFLAVTAC